MSPWVGWLDAVPLRVCGGRCRRTSPWTRASANRSRRQFPGLGAGPVQSGPLRPGPGADRRCGGTESRDSQSAILHRNFAVLDSQRRDCQCLELFDLSNDRFIHPDVSLSLDCQPQSHGRSAATRKQVLNGLVSGDNSVFAAEGLRTDANYHDDVRQPVPSPSTEPTNLPIIES